MYVSAVRNTQTDLSNQVRKESQTVVGIREGHLLVVTSGLYLKWWWDSGYQKKRGIYEHDKCTGVWKIWVHLEGSNLSHI